MGVKKNKAVKDGLTLLPGGRLEHTRWVYDEKKGEGRYVTRDVTDDALSFLFAPVRLSKKTTLRDIFTLVSSKPGLFDVVIGNWCLKFVAETLDGEPVIRRTAGRDEIEFLEIYHVFSVEDGVLEGVSRPSFHGVGVAQKKDYMADDGKTVMWKKGSRIPWGISFSDTRELADLPVRISDTVPLCMGDGSVINLPGPRVTLGSLLNAVFWELSFYGPPEKRDSVRKSIEDDRVGAKSGGKNGKNKKKRA